MRWREKTGGFGDAPRVNHVHTVLEGSADNVILGEICCDGRQALADAICFVSLSVKGVLVSFTLGSIIAI